MNSTYRALLNLLFISGLWQHPMTTDRDLFLRDDRRRRLEQNSIAAKFKLHVVGPDATSAYFLMSRIKVESRVVHSALFVCFGRASTGPWLRENADNDKVHCAPTCVCLKLWHFL